MASLNVNSDVVAVSFASATLAINLQQVSCTQLDIHAPRPSKENETSDGSVPVVCSSLSQSGKYLAVTSHKTLTVWMTATWELKSQKTLVRAASGVSFAPSENRLVVADKSGDVYLVELAEEKEPVLILGHVSMLLDVLITPDEKFVITADRDEKIRVSHFPRAYNIQSYCLGHEEFVTSLQLLPHDHNVLVSSGGDGNIIFWNYISGKHLLKCPCSDTDSCIVTQIKCVEFAPTTSLLCSILYNINGVLIFTISSGESLSCTLTQIINVENQPWCIATSLNNVWVINKTRTPCISSYSFNGKSFEPTEVSKSVAKTLEPYMDLFEDALKHVTKTIDPLHKKRYDNVQEYMRRKADRMEETIKKFKSTHP